MPQSGQLQGRTRLGRCVHRGHSAEHKLLHLVAGVCVCGPPSHNNNNNNNNTEPSKGRAKGRRMAAPG